MKPEVNILIGSGGRRNYLVNWFRAAIRDAGMRGRVCVIDSSPAAPALADADEMAVVPSFDSPDYFSSLETLCEKWSVDLAFSLNDFESSLWASASESPFLQMERINLVAASAECQRLVEDKAGYHRRLAAIGVSSPPTLVGSDALECEDLPWGGSRVVIKHRFGSGSNGLTICDRTDWRTRLMMVAERAADRNGRPAAGVPEGLQNTLVQQAIEGTEYGLDLVSDFNAVPQGLLARRKIRMRAGETDQAISQSPGPFLEMTRRLSSLTGHRGLIDVDVIVDNEGTQWLLDINPRFGGGYPFSHVAGANVPAAYLAWHLGLRADPLWLQSSVGVMSAKTEDIRLARTASEEDARG